MTAYFNGRFMEKDEIRISPDDRGFLFSDSLYEVIRYYPGLLFRPEAHIRRLNHGADHLRLACRDFSRLVPAARDLIRQNNLTDQDALVYIQVTRGAAPRNHPFPDPVPEPTVYMCVSGFDPAVKDRQRKTGIHAITVPDIRWARCDMKTTGLTANILASQQAAEKQAGEAIFVRDGVLMEGTHSNFMAVFDNTVTTAPLSNYILGGITRGTVLDLCRELNIRTSREPVYDNRIHLASELMITGTTTEITPIVTLNTTPVGNGTPGPVAQALQAAFSTKIQQMQKQAPWFSPVKKGGNA
ncbi:MAG TPA: aminotransferase class IV [Desulfotignum sp.]|nr:aminotransferase class IV [Desulfotignum sp.]